MADNIAFTPGSGGTLGADDIGGVHFVRNKLIHGVDGTNDGDVSATNPLPITAGTGVAIPVTDNSSTLSIDDGAGSITVDGTVAISGTVTVGSHAVTNAGTFAVQVDGTGLTRLTDIETNTDSGAVVGNGAAATAQRVTLANDSTGIVALTTSTASIGKLAANSGVDIGDVDVTSVVPGTGATNLGKAIDTATGATDTGVLVLATRDDALSALTPVESDNVQLRVDANGALWTHDDALDAAISGSELQVDVVAALPAGTNAIGKLAANSGVDIGDVDVTSIAAGDNNIGNVDIVTVPSDPFGANADAASATGSISAKLRFIAATGIPVTGTVAVTQSGTWDEVGINDSGNSITVDNAGTFAVQSADRNGVVIRPTITSSASPDYVAGDVIDTTKTLSSVMSASGRQAVLKTVTVKDAAGQAPAMSLLFFRAAPSGGTYTDNAALAWGAGDLGNLIGVVRIASSDYYTLAGKSSVTLSGLDMLMGSASSDLSMLIIADAAYNGASTSDLSMELCFEQR